MKEPKSLQVPNGGEILLEADQVAEALFAAGLDEQAKPIALISQTLREGYFATGAEPITDLTDLIPKVTAVNVRTAALFEVRSALVNEQKSRADQDAALVNGFVEAYPEALLVRVGRVGRFVTGAVRSDYTYRGARIDTVGIAVDGELYEPSDDTIVWCNTAQISDEAHHIATDFHERRTAILI